MQVHLLQLVLTPIGEIEGGREREERQSEREGGKEDGRDGGRKEGVVACCGPRTQVSASTSSKICSLLFLGIRARQKEIILTWAHASLSVHPRLWRTKKL
jgi:hypothetical protein